MSEQTFTDQWNAVRAQAAALTGKPLGSPSDSIGDLIATGLDCVEGKGATARRNAEFQAMGGNLNCAAHHFYLAVKMVAALKGRAPVPTASAQSKPAPPKPAPTKAEKISALRSQLDSATPADKYRIACQIRELATA